ncbi:DNA methylase [Kitasatospora purpeofusca]|uniref:DNA methylase n=1 Tax=Kitasatospora purpeofusca TaxID=67352 RepID=UPI002A5A7A76|nr:DNA methylase [Kitasatospora purpeofusca]MDY0809891.1 DNA methylase [Kitasatospora purpeofusca]
MTPTAPPLKVLDAFCCAGGAGSGYAAAGFDVTGVDIAPQPNYPHRFVQGDAVEYIRAHGHEYDLIHTSPPCQHDCTLTAGTNAAKRDTYPDLLEPTRAVLDAVGRPYVIEQPPGGASRRMRADLTLCGEMFDLRVIRHRIFELGGWFALQPPHVPHRGRTAGYRHGVRHEGWYFQVYGNGGGKGTVAEWQDAMGIHWTAERRELAEAIPPAYTHLIGSHAADWLGAEQVAA